MKALSSAQDARSDTEDGEVQVWYVPWSIYMGYYRIPLDEYSQRLCTTILHWGKFKYKRLPTGVACAPDIFQETMNKLLGDLDYVSV